MFMSAFAYIHVGALVRVLWDTGYSPILFWDMGYLPYLFWDMGYSGILGYWILEFILGYIELN